MPGSLYLDRSAPTLDHLVIRGSGSDGLYAYASPALVVERAQLESNEGDGLEIMGGAGAHRLTDVTARLNNGHGLQAAHAGSLEVVASTLSDNDGYGIFTNDGGAAMTLRDSQVQGNGVAARLAPAADLDRNDWSDNDRGEIEWIAGSVDVDTAWRLLPGIRAYRVLGDITVADGVTLTVEADTQVLFEGTEDGGGVLVAAVAPAAGTRALATGTANLYVNGTLIAVGDVDTPVYFGPVERDGTWGEVRIGGGVPGDSDLSRLQYVVVERGQLRIEQSAPAVLDHLSILNSTNDGLYVNDSEGVVVTSSNFVGNSRHGLFNETPDKVVSATLNYWGATSGPYHPTLNPAGQGDRVGDGVLFAPWGGPVRMDAFQPFLVRRTPTDDSTLSYDFTSDSFTRLYPDGRQVHFNAERRHDFTLEPDGRKTIYTYNADGSIAMMGVVAPGESVARWVWTFTYSNGRLTGITDPAGRAMAFRVDDQEPLRAATYPDGTTHGLFYDARGLLPQQQDRNGAVTSYVYDDYGRLARRVGAARAVYDPATGQIVVGQEVRRFVPSDTAYPFINTSPVGDPDSPAPRVPLSNELADRVSYGRGGRVGYTNKWGSWLAETDALGRTTSYERDAANNVTLKTFPNGDCERYTYDERGNRSSEELIPGCSVGGTPGVQPAGIVANGRARTFTYEPRFNQLKTETDALGRTTTYVYDYEEGVGEAGKLIRTEYPAVRDENGNTVTPMVRRTYNALGLLESKTDERGTVTRYVYTQGTPDEAAGGANPLFAAGVTPVPGLLTRVIEDAGDATHLNLTTLHKEFDAAGHALTVVGPNGAATHFTYDAQGRKATETDALGIVTRYEYDGRGNMVTRIVDYTPDGTTGRNVVTTHTYDDEDRLLREQTVADGLVQQTVNSYDIGGNLASQTDGNGNTTTYAYDDAGQRIAETDPLGATTN
ncbi:MAG TPA: right-handed parallel beta-helix repeat-containing protein, partial [Ardenticatenaceae bacterium]|nr:right-handed parallel beta-helix repeat-containing protein [Ardenticatenaceae bacterium]